MSAEIKTLMIAEKQFSESDIVLIKQTVAKGASDQELKLFLYRCKNMGLDPLKPGMIFFVKYGSSPGTIVVGIDGFRAMAERTGKRAGVRRGLLKDSAGQCIGAWCEVYRKDWTEPAREEVSLSEYNTGKAMWAKMPETMIKKVAEAAALRMAFPDELGGIYSEEEMHQAKPVERDARAVIPQVSARPEFENYEIELEPETEQSEQGSAGDYVLKTGKTNKGKSIKSVSSDKLQGYVDWYDKKQAAGENMHQDVTEDVFFIRSFLESELVE